MQARRTVIGVCEHKHPIQHRLVAFLDGIHRIGELEQGLHIDLLILEAFLLIAESGIDRLLVRQGVVAGCLALEAKSGHALGDGEIDNVRLATGQRACKQAGEEVVPRHGIARHRDHPAIVFGRLTRVDTGQHGRGLLQLNLQLVFKGAQRREIRVQLGAVRSPQLAHQIAAALRHGRERALFEHHIRIGREFGRVRILEIRPEDAGIERQGRRFR